MALLSPVQAAELIGKHRSTINRAIEKGHLSATRDEFGRYLVDPAELERVYGTLRIPGGCDPSRDVAEEQDATSEHAGATTRETEELLREMLARERAAYERERSVLERERQAWEEERTFLRSMLEKHTEHMKLLADQREERDRRTEQSRSFLARWLRRP